jgi:hypothetical protein
MATHLHTVTKMSVLPSVAPKSDGLGAAGGYSSGITSFALPVPGCFRKHPCRLEDGEEFNKFPKKGVAAPVV